MNKVYYLLVDIGVHVKQLWNQSYCKIYVLAIPVMPCDEMQKNFHKVRQSAFILLTAAQNLAQEQDIYIILIGIEYDTRKYCLS